MGGANVISITTFDKMSRIGVLTWKQKTEAAGFDLQSYFMSLVENFSCIFFLTLCY